MDTRETITSDEAAQRRLTILTHLLADDLTLEEAAILLDLSTRQVRRLIERLGREGAAALVHGNCGRRPVNHIAEGHRAELLELADTTYLGSDPVHMAESIAEEHPELAVSARSLRRILAAGGIAPVRTRRPPRHRSRRERMPRAGMLLQADGSKHDWLEGRGPWLTLIAGIDDAIGEFGGATFREQEDAAGYFEMLAQTARGPGLPLALHTDRHGIFVNDPERPPTLSEQLSGQRSLTQMGRALEALGIRWIPAGSPQAKGRSERAFRHAAGPARLGAASGGCLDDRGGRGGPAALPATLQRALRRAARDRGAGLASVALALPHRGRALLPLPAHGLGRCHHPLGRHRPRGAEA